MPAELLVRAIEYSSTWAEGDVSAPRVLSRPSYCRRSPAARLSLLTSSGIIDPVFLRTAQRPDSDSVFQFLVQLLQFRFPSPLKLNLDTVWPSNSTGSTLTVKKYLSYQCRFQILRFL